MLKLLQQQRYPTKQAGREAVAVAAVLAAVAAHQAAAVAAVARTKKITSGIETSGS
jgi:hypothetical protein